MNIVMMTNSYKPLIGGLEKSIETFTEELRKRGHRVLVVAPEFKGFPCCREKDVFRFPAIHNFQNIGFSIELPIPNRLPLILEKFKADIIHSHHPFLIGDTALRISAKLNRPMVYTYHTLYENNAPYFPDIPEVFIKFASRLSLGYANLCDRVIAPSQGIALFLRKRGVRKHIDVVPTGIRIEDFNDGDASVFRKFFGIPSNAFTVGTVSRIAPEKNIIFLTRAVAKFLKQNKRAYFLMVGQGESLEPARDMFKKEKIIDRVVFSGELTGRRLTNAYAAMDVFAFASHSETQGIILAEAMSAGKAVVAVDAQAVREVVKDKQNGRIIVGDSISEFSNALSWMARRNTEELSRLSRCARKTAKDFSLSNSVKKILKVYKEACKNKRGSHDLDNSSWGKTMRMLKAQLNLLVNTAQSTVSAVVKTGKVG